MTLRLSARDRRTAIVGIIAAVLIVVFGKAGPAWRRWDAAARASLEQARSSAAARRGLLASGRDISDTLQAREARLRAARELAIGGASPQQAAAELAGMVTNGAVDSGVRLEYLQMLSDSGYVDGVARVGVSVAVSADVTGLANFMAWVEGGAPLLTIRQLAISQPDVEGSSGRPEVLRSELVIGGFSLQPEKPSR